MRRTLYVTVAREELHHMLRMYDFPEASSHSPRREPTTTPLQQLFVLNSPWMEEQTNALRDRLVPASDSAETPDINVIVRQSYRTLFGRWPNEQELQVAQSFLNADQAPVSKERWAEYLQVLLGINELYFVD